jgi:hypothetical protein
VTPVSGGFLEAKIPQLENRFSKCTPFMSKPGNKVQEVITKACASVEEAATRQEPARESILQKRRFAALPQPGDHHNRHDP